MPLRAYRPSPTSPPERETLERNLGSLGGQGSCEQERCYTFCSFSLRLRPRLGSAGTVIGAPRLLIRRNRRELVHRTLGDHADELVLVVGAAGRDAGLRQVYRVAADQVFLGVREHGDLDFYLEVAAGVV